MLNFSKFFPLLKFRVFENSMTPALSSGDLVLAWRTKNLKKNDTVIFERDEDYYIKRVTKIDGDKFFVEGDNKKESIDSREFGWVNKKDIIGKVILKISN